MANTGVVKRIKIAEVIVQVCGPISDLYKTLDLLWFNLAFHVVSLMTFGRAKGNQFGHLARNQDTVSSSSTLSMKAS